MSFTDSLTLGRDIGRQLLRQRPFLLYLKPTARCDCRCRTCNRWIDRPTTDLPLDLVCDGLETFRRAGCSVLTLWGGEPTLHRQLPEMLTRAKQLGYRTSLCTNCNSLARRADHIAPLMDVMLCSLDGHGELHDQVRGLPGLFERVAQGIRAAARANPSCDIKIWASVHRKNLHQLEQLATLARDLGVGIEYFPLSAISGYNDKLLLTPEERQQAFGELLRLKRNHWPVRNPTHALQLMQRGAPFRCNFGQISIHVDPDGRVCSCEDAEGHPFRVWGQLGQVDPEALYGSEAFRALGRELRGCGRCSLPCAVELSGNLPRALAGMFLRSLG